MKAKVTVSVFTLILAFVLSSSEVQADLVAHYTFDDGTFNDSVGGFHGTGVGDAVVVVNDPERGMVLSLGGTDDGVAINGMSDPGTGEITIAAWVNRSVGWSSRSAVVYTSWYTANNGNFHFRTEGVGTLTLGWEGQSNTSGTTLIPNGEWHHIAATASASEIVVYVDGVREGSRVPDADWTGAIGLDNNLTIGYWNRVGAGDPIQQEYSGLIDDVRLYDHVMTEEEINAAAGGITTIRVDAGPDQQVQFISPSMKIPLLGTVTVYGPPLDPNQFTYSWSIISEPDAGGPNAASIVDNAGDLRLDPNLLVQQTGTYEVRLEAGDGEVTGSDTTIIQVFPEGYDNLVLHYKLDETSGAVAADSAGSLNLATQVRTCNPGTVMGDPVWTEGVDFENNVLLQDPTDFGNALECNLNEGDDDWIDAGNDPNWRITGNNPRTATAWVFTKEFNNGGIYDYGSYTAGKNFSLRTLATKDSWRVQYWGIDIDFSYPSHNKWVHFAHVHDGTRTKIYADGIMIVDEERTLNTTDTANLRVGSWRNDYFHGIIDDFRLYDRALSEAEILAICEITVPDLLLGIDNTGMCDPLIPGDKIRIPVVFQNYTDSDMEKNSVAVDIYLLPEGTVEPGAGDTPIGQVNVSTKASALDSTTSTAKVTLPGDLDITPGEYILYLDVPDSLTGPGGLLEGMRVALGYAEIAWRFGNLSGTDSNRKKAVKLKFSGDDGSSFQFSLSSAGWGEITPDGGDIHGAAFALQDTTTSSTFKIVAKNDQFFVGDITTSGSLKSLSAKGIDLDGDVTIGGTVKQVTMNDVLFLPGVDESHTITINGGDPAESSQAAKFTFNRICDLSIQSPQMPIKMITATEWCNTEGSAEETFTAPWVNKITMKGNSKASIPGNIEVNVNLTGESAPKDTCLSSAKISGSICGGDWYLRRNVGSLSADSMENALLFVGPAEGITEPNDIDTIFDTEYYTLNSLSLSGKTGVDMVDGTVVAWTIGSIKLSSSGTATGEVYYVNLDRDKNVSPSEKNITFIPITPHYLILSSAPVSDTQIDLTWEDNNPQTATHYEVHRSDESGFTPEAGTLLDGTVISSPYSDTAVPANLTTYYYKVVAIFDGGIDPYPSNETSGMTGAFLEAEGGTLGALWETPDDVTASGGQYLNIIAGNTSIDDLPGADGIATYTIDIPEAGDYMLHGRVIIPSDQDDSFWVRISNATSSQITREDDWVNWNNTDIGADWHWDAIHNADQSNNVVIFTLPAGTQTLEIGYREDGAQWDRIAIGPVNFIPMD